MKFFRKSQDERSDVVSTKTRRISWLGTLWNAPGLRSATYRTRHALLQLKDLTGFFAYTDSKGEYHRGKTLWDWLSLLVVPAVLATAAIWFNQSQNARTLEIEQDRAREETLHTYLNEMEDLLLNRDLLAAKDGSDSTVLAVAQVKTITALRILDRERRDRIFQFLRDSGLADFLLIHASIQNVNLDENNLSDLHLSQADLSGASLNGATLFRTDLSEAILHKANLHDAFFSNTSLRGAFLFEADLSETHLRGENLVGTNLVEANLFGASLPFADLSGAKLCKANMIGVNMYKTNLTGADLRAADLRGAYLNEATITDEQLANVASLEGAVMPDGKEYDPKIHTPSDNVPSRNK